MIGHELKNASDVINFLKSHDLPEKFCIIPFINIILGPGGDVSICRQKGTKHIVGSLKSQNLEEIWNNEYLTNWRKEFLTGNPKICANEVKNVHCNLSPEHYIDFEKSDLKPNMNFPFKKLTANFNGECNIKCVMCNVWKQENGFYNNENFWNEARTKILPFIQEIEMLSGEPLIQSDTFKLIEEMKEINPNAYWSFTTNGQWDYLGKIENAIKGLRIKRFIFSIDSFDEKLFSKIRVGGDLTKVLQNLSIVKKVGQESREPFSPTIHFLMMKNNYHEVPNVYEYCRNNNIKLILDLCEYPEQLSLLSFSNEIKVKIATEWMSVPNKDSLRAMMGVLLRLIDKLSNSEKKKLLLEALEKVA